MPRPGFAWWHVMWHTYGTWLHGSEKGFRDRDHRIHSSGDYKHRPPPDEHAGLRDYMKRITKGEVVLHTVALRREVCEAIVATLRELEFRIMIVTVCRVHVHAVAELPLQEDPFDDAMAKLKTKSSARVKGKPQPRLWARLWDNRLLRTRERRNGAFAYVRDDQGRYCCTYIEGHGIVRST